MQEIELSIFNRDDGGASIQPLLDEFERTHNTHVEVELLEWGEGWGKLVEVALYGHGPDLSEVGSTWLMDFVRMNAINSISPLEMGPIGREKDFMPTNWHTATTTSSTSEAPFVWAIPWTSDIRMAYYRRDLFEKAGIDPTHTFEHIDSISQAMAALKAKDIAAPVTIGTLHSRNNLHALASWIWDAGGELVAADGRRVAFDSPEALHGIRSYFQLGQFLPGNQRRIIDVEADRLFQAGGATTIFSGYWILRDPSTPIVRENLGMAAMPGASFVGGTHLLPWKHSRKRELALALADFLVKHSAEHNVFPKFGLPAYVPSWDNIHFLAEPYFTTLFEALQKGRTFPISQLWGLVEKRLVDVIPIIWEKIWETDGKDIDKVLAETITPMAERINMTLE